MGDSLYNRQMERRWGYDICRYLHFGKERYTKRSIVLYGSRTLAPRLQDVWRRWGVWIARPYSFFDKVIYIEQLYFLTDRVIKIYKLLELLYGLNQSPRK